MTDQHTAPTEPTREALIADLQAFHDCADGKVEDGNGHFRLVCTSRSDQQRLNLRAVLREAIAALTHPAPAAQQNEPWAGADLSEPPFAYRFEYADGSGFEVMEDGETFLTWPNGKRERKHGKITSNIRRLIGRAIILRERSRAAPPAPSSQKGMREALEDIWALTASYTQYTLDHFARKVRTKVEVALSTPPSPEPLASPLRQGEGK